MKLLIVIFLYTFIYSGSGNVQYIGNNGIKRQESQQPNHYLVPVTEEYILPQEAYQTFQDKFENPLRKNIKTEPCLNSILQDSLSRSNQQVNSPNRRSQQDDNAATYINPSKMFDSANLQSQVLQKEDNQPKTLNNKNLKNEVQNPVLTNSDYDLLGTIESLEIMKSTKDPSQDNNFIITENKKDKTVEINDLRYNADLLINLPSTTIKPITDIQCEDKNRLRSINDISRRFLISENERPINNNHFQPMNSNFNALRANSNISVPKRGNIQKASDNNPMFDINKSLSSGNNGFQTEMLSNKNINDLNDPTVGQGISYMNKGELMLIDYDRICYACSSANNPTCLSPDRRTTVKYCRKGVESCSTKSFRTGSTVTLIRDCSKSCDDFAVQGLGLKYQSCSICHSDLCNNGTYNNASSLKLTLPGFIFVVLIKAFL